ncbi:hypothetical protein BpHYR1_044693 [Brachionus plicatilis]|uniref:Uncharacterized protein n=1 Tax=Brachionus plicatilis TaxID=10195 RepID=A0A3M7PJ83_BRAPC|nr:hypothetical protein BpHYR1_044693 [Brachionus plicatilis]
MLLRGPKSGGFRCHRTIDIIKGSFHENVSCIRKHLTNTLMDSLCKNEFNFFLTKLKKKFKY